MSSRVIPHFLSVFVESVGESGFCGESAATAGSVGLPYSIAPAGRQKKEKRRGGNRREEKKRKKREITEEADCMKLGCVGNGLDNKLDKEW